MLGHLCYDQIFIPDARQWHSYIDVLLIALHYVSFVICVCTLHVQHGRARKHPSADAPCLRYNNFRRVLDPYATVVMTMLRLL
jgi:hypothetical protein